MRKIHCVFLFVCVFFVVFQSQDSNENWGSFTSAKTYSYDSKYYAIQNTKERDNISFIDVVIYNNKDEMVYSFSPARAFDFWGICWENDNYNIWVQSGDVGTLCYSYDNKEWSLNASAIRPDYIVSKYDDIT